MVNEPKKPTILVSGAEENFLKTMLSSAKEKYKAPEPSRCNCNTAEIEKLTKNIQEGLVRKKLYNE